jgi:hypothetical protein
VPGAEAGAETGERVRARAPTHALKAGLLLWDYPSVSKKLLNHPKHGKHAMLHLLYLCILPLSDSVK